MKTINPLELGATLFVPASHKDIKTIASGKKYPKLRSILIDFEDGLDENNREESLQQLQTFLKEYEKKELFVFVRPTNPTILQTILNFDNVEKLHGFVLPKFSLNNADDYLALMSQIQMPFMPSIETQELFDNNKLLELKTKLLSFREQIILVRIGVEDMLKSLKMKRRCSQSLFDIAVTSHTIANFLSTFKSSGFAVSGGVYPCFKDSEGFMHEVKRDLIEGFVSKTIIHPNQIELFEECYRVKQEDFDEAVALCQSEKAVFAHNNKMQETVTMTPYAQDIILRSELYGLC
jgi:citrate lyase beta subunit